MSHSLCHLLKLVRDGEVEVRELQVARYDAYKHIFYLVFTVTIQFTTPINPIWGQFWHQTVSIPFRSQLRGSNCVPSYQVQHQSLVNQLTIGSTNTY